jgi:hypothetical protein
MEFEKGLTSDEKDRYNQLVMEMNNCSDFERLKKIQTDIFLLKEKGLVRMKQNKSSYQ